MSQEVESIAEKLSNISNTFGNQVNQLVSTFTTVWRTWKQMIKYELGEGGKIFCRSNRNKMHPHLQIFDSFEEDLTELNARFKKCIDKYLREVRRGSDELHKWFEDLLNEHRQLTDFELDWANQELSNRLGEIGKAEFRPQQYNKLEKLINGYRKGVFALLSFLWHFCSKIDRNLDPSDEQQLNTTGEIVKLACSLLQNEGELRENEKVLKKNVCKQMSALTRTLERDELSESYLEKFDKYLGSTNFFLEMELLAKAISSAMSELKLAFDPIFNLVIFS